MVGVRVQGSSEQCFMVPVLVIRVEGSGVVGYRDAIQGLGLKGWRFPLLHDCRSGALQERWPPRQKSRVERLKAKTEPLLTQVIVDYRDVADAVGSFASEEGRPLHREAIERTWNS